MRTTPAPVRERLALRFFLSTQHYPEPPREAEYRAAGQATMVGGCHATAFGPDDAPVALMTHGWSGRGLQLCAFVDPLVDAGYRVIAMDGPACGRNPGNHTSIPEWVRAIRQAIQEVQPAALVGHSFGSVTGIFALAAEGSNANVLCLGGPADPYHIVDRYRNYVRAPPRGRDRFTDLLLKRVGARVEDFDIHSASSELNGRLHCVVTTDDEDVPWEESVRIVEGAGGTSTVLEGISHRAVMWDPEAVDAGLDFLGEPA